VFPLEIKSSTEVRDQVTTTQDNASQQTTKKKNRRKAAEDARDKIAALLVTIESD
jgi:hypothetical protein